MGKYRIDDFQIGDVVSEMEEPRSFDEFFVVERIVNDGKMSRLDCGTAMIFPEDVKFVSRKIRKG